MVWVIEWTQPGQSEYHSTVWATEQDALRQACNDMLERISDWDLDDTDIESNARKINDLVANGDFKTALNEYSDYESESDYEYSQFWNVYEQKTIKTRPAAPTLLLFSDPDDEDEDNEDDEEEEIDFDTEEPYQASVPGATCRGPCKAVNEHAYADRRDGTHVCYQCKLMSQVFGGTIT